MGTFKEKRGLQSKESFRVCPCRRMDLDTHLCVENTSKRVIWLWRNWVTYRKIRGGVIVAISAFFYLIYFIPPLKFSSKINSFIIFFFLNTMKFFKSRDKKLSPKNIAILLKKYKN